VKVVLLTLKERIHWKWTGTSSRLVDITWGGKLFIV